MIPAVAQPGLAEFCDVFCEEGVFTVEESRRILESGARARPRSCGSTPTSWGGPGAPSWRPSWAPRSADHLVFVSEAGMRALAEASLRGDPPARGRLLPAARPRYAPARALIEAGAPVALASDVNPGGGLSPSLPFAMALGCFAMGLSLEEALAAVTINPAFSLGRHGEVGSLEAGQAGRPGGPALAAPAGPRARGRAGHRAVVKDGRVVVATTAYGPRVGASLSRPPC